MPLHALFQIFILTYISPYYGLFLSTAFHFTSITSCVIINLWLCIYQFKMKAYSLFIRMIFVSKEYQYLYLRLINLIGGLLMKRKWLGLIYGTATLSLLAACSGSSESGSDPDQFASSDESTITVWA